jgi:cephalosporin hydroxylase
MSWRNAWADELLASERGGWEAIPGYFNFQDIYRDAVREAPKGATLVEVGVFLGRSLAFLAREAIDQKRDDLKIVGIDPWEWNDTHPDAPVQAALDEFGGKSRAAFEGMMMRHAPIERKRVSVHQATSDALVTTAGVPSPWFVFIDADHSYAAVKQDIATWRPRIAKGGILAGHDYDQQFPGVIQAVTEAFGPDCHAPPSSWWVRL